MKTFCLALSLAVFGGCASRRADDGPWLFPRGTQVHNIRVFRGDAAEPAFAFRSALRLTESDAQLVALSPFGPTLFKIDDSRSAHDFTFRDLNPMLADRERDLKRVYSRLRPLFWMRLADKPSEIELVERAVDGSASEVAWSLHGFRVDIRVERAGELQ